MGSEQDLWCDHSAHDSLVSPCRGATQELPQRLTLGRMSWLGLVCVRATTSNDEGQDLIEYSLLAALVAIGAIAAVSLFGGVLEQAWTGIDVQFRAALVSVGLN